MNHDDCLHVCKEDHASTFYEKDDVEMIEMPWLCYCFICSMVVFA